MDEMRIGSKFITGIISKLLVTVVKQKLGYNIDFKLNAVNATVGDGKAHAHLDIDAEVSNEEIMRILSGVGL